MNKKVVISGFIVLLIIVVLFGVGHVPLAVAQIPMNSGDQHNISGWFAPEATAPVAVSDTYAMLYNTTLTVSTAEGVLANDIDADGDSLSAQLVGGASHGTLTLNSDGSFEYVPNLGYIGVDTFTYQAFDGVFTSSPATVTINVKGDNTAPVAVADTYTTLINTTLTVPAATGVLANDTDADGDVLTARLLGGASQGTLTFYADGSFEYIPNSGYVGTDTFTYEAYDGIDDSNPATVNINVKGTNTDPVAVNDTYSVETGTTLTVIAPGILANDYDADGDLLTVQQLGGAVHGILTLLSDGSFTYVPDSSYIGADYFTYQAFDGLDLSNPATVTINVTSTEDNTPPIAVVDTYNTLTNTTLTVESPGVLSNDFDADGDPLTAILVGQPAQGSLSLYPDGSFVYVPDPDYYGDDHFTYKAFDGRDYSNPTMVTISVKIDNTPPVANADSYAVEVDALLIVNATNGVLANDLDADGDYLIAQQLGKPSNGSLTMYADGSFMYMPDTGFVGVDYFTYQAYDGVDVSLPAVVTINVAGENTPPVAVADTYSVITGKVLNVSAPGVLGNDYDMDGDSLTAQLLTGVSHGTLTLNPNGSFTYQSNAGYVGTDSFTYEAVDWLDSSNAALVRINVLPTYLYAYLAIVIK